MDLTVTAAALVAASDAYAAIVHADVYESQAARAARTKLEKAQAAHQAAIEQLDQDPRDHPRAAMLAGWVNELTPQISELRLELAELTNEFSTFRRLVAEQVAQLRVEAEEAEARRAAVRLPGGGWYHQGERDAYRRAVSLLDGIVEASYDR